MSNESARQDITCSRLFAVKPKKLLQRLYHDGLITLQQAEEVFRERKPEESAQQTIIRLGLLSHEQMLHYTQSVQWTDPVSDSPISVDELLTGNEEPEDIACSRLFAVKSKKLLQRLYQDGVITLEQAEEILSARKPEEPAQLTIIQLGLLSPEQIAHYVRLLGQVPHGEASSPQSAQGADPASDSHSSAEQLESANEEHRSLTYSDTDSYVRPNPPSDQEEQGSKTQTKTKKQKEKEKDAPLSLGDQLLREKVITAEQLEQSVAQQGRTGESLIRILVQNGCVQLPQLEPYVKLGDLRKFAVLELENDYYQGILRIMLVHRRNFQIFLGVLALTILTAVWFHDQIQLLVYLGALAALATVYHRIQRRYYDLQAFFRQTRMTVLNAMDACTTVGELTMVRDNGRAGFAMVLPLDYQLGSSRSGNRRPVGWRGVSIAVVFVALLLLGAIKTNAGLPLPRLSQNTMQAQSVSVKRLSFRKFSGP
jgi:hypothetical protein